MLHPTLKQSKVRYGLVPLALVIAASSAGCGKSGLSGSSSCKDYMNSSQGDQQKVVSSLAGKYRKPDWATPLGFTGVAYYCATHPKTTLDQFFAAADE
jgi:hypothetical protein